MPHQGHVNATIFENPGQNGNFYTVRMERSYLEGEGENAERKDTNSFKPADIDDVIKQAQAVQAKVKELSATQGQGR